MSGLRPAAVAACLLTLAGSPVAARARRTVLAADSPRALAVIRQAVGQLHAGSSVVSAGPDGLALAEALHTLRGIAAFYARSEFDRCAQSASAVEQALAEHRQADGAALATLKRLGHWLGLCRQAAGDLRRAREAYLLAARLPGPDPDANLFPPEAMRLYQEAARAPRARCKLQLPQEVTSLVLDERKVADGALVEVGDHYAAWLARSGSRAARVRLARDCRLELPEAPASGRTPLAPTGLGAAASGAWLVDLGRAERATHAVLVSVDADTLGAVVVRVEEARVTERSQASIGPDQAAGAVLAALLRRLLGIGSPPIASSVPASAPATTTAWVVKAAPGPAPVPPRPWYRRWWVWTAVGAGIAAVVIPVAVVVGSRSGGSTTPHYDLVFQ